MKKLCLMLAISLGAHTTIKAQYLYPVNGQTDGDKIEKLFSESTDSLNMNFSIQLNKDVVMHVNFPRIDDWKGEAGFLETMNIAAGQLYLYKDTIKGFANSKRLDIHIPEEKDQIISRYTTSNNLNNLRVAQVDGKLSGLKTEKDTLRVFQLFEINIQKHDAYTPKHQYTFVTKDLTSLESVLKDEQKMRASAHLIDSLTTVYKRKWRRPNKEFHSLYAKYNPGDSNRVWRVSPRSIDREKTVKASVISSFGVGVSLVRNTLCPASNLGLQFCLPEYRDRRNALFFKFSMYSYVRYEFSSSVGYAASFFQLEYGWKNKISDSRKFLFSLGLGYKPRGILDPTMDEQSYKFFFTYGFNERIVLQSDFVLGKKGYQGITLNFQLF